MFATSPPLAWWPLAFVAVAPLLWLLRSAGGRRGAALGFAFGLACYGATFYWIERFGQMAWLSLTLLCTASAVVFGLLAPAVIRRGRPVLTAVGLASLWTVMDWIRALWPLGGFSWGSLGVSQVDNQATVRFATIAGVWGVTFVVVAVNALLVEAVAGGGGAGRRGGLLGLAAVLIVAPLLIPFSVPNGRDVRRGDAPGRRPPGGERVGGERGPGCGAPAHRRSTRSSHRILRTSRSGARERSIPGPPTTRGRRERAAGDRCGGRPHARRRGHRRPRRHPAHERDPVRRIGAARRIATTRCISCRSANTSRGGDELVVDLGAPADPRRPDAGGARAHAVDDGPARLRHAHLLREQLPRADTCVRQGRCGVPRGAGEQRVLRDHGGIGAAPPDEPHARGGGRPVGRRRRRLGDQRVRRSRRDASCRRWGCSNPRSSDTRSAHRTSITAYVRLGDWFPWLSLVVVAGMVLVPRRRSGVRPAPEPLPPTDAGRS